MGDRSAPPPPDLPGPAGPGIYPEREDTRLLLPFARPARDGERVLEIGTGGGRIALESARAGARTVATDLHLGALRRLRRIALDERLPLDVVRTDLARGLGRFDRILANPPYLPTTPDERDPDLGTNLALDGGADGCRVTARIVAQLPEHLAPRGRAFVLVSTVQAPNSLERIRIAWERRRGRVRIVATRDLEGERLAVWELRPPDPGDGP